MGGSRPSIEGSVLAEAIDIYNRERFEQQTGRDEVARKSWIVPSLTRDNAAGLAEVYNRLISDETENCDAVLHAGPGHQSAIGCEMVGQHEIHYVEYQGGAAYWRGPEATTGYFDEPPSFDG
jgi:hypothetical protein